MGSAFRARHVRDGQCEKSALARSESGASWIRHVNAGYFVDGIAKI
jgi:hypothetical protein